MLARLPPLRPTARLPSRVGFNVVTRLLKLITALVAIVLLGGCGGSSGGGSATNGIEKLTADKALAKVKADAATVKSVHVKGDIVQSGNTLGLDVHAGQSEGEGTLTVGGGTVELKLVDGEAYLRGDEAALKSFGASDQELAATAGKWLKSSASGGQFDSFSTFLDTEQLFTSLLDPNGTVKTGELTTLNGEKAFTLIDTATDAEGGGGTLYVAATGKALPLRIAKAGTEGGSVDFLDYDAELNVEAPADAIDISQLGG
jgi:hypothetical protein